MSDRIISAVIGAIAAILVGLIPIALRRHKEAKSLACRQAAFEERISLELDKAHARLDKREKDIVALRIKIEELIRENVALHAEIKFLRTNPPNPKAQVNR